MGQNASAKTKKNLYAWLHHWVGHTTWASKGRKGRSQAGPKGRKLEVGAQWAPRLLVDAIFFLKIANKRRPSSQNADERGDIHFGTIMIEMAWEPWLTVSDGVGGEFGKKSVKSRTKWSCGLHTVLCLETRKFCAVRAEKNSCLFLMIMKTMHVKLWCL